MDVTTSSAHSAHWPLSMSGSSFRWLYCTSGISANRRINNKHLRLFRGDSPTEMVLISVGGSSKCKSRHIDMLSRCVCATLSGTFRGGVIIGAPFDWFRWGFSYTAGMHIAFWAQNRVIFIGMNAKNRNLKAAGSTKIEKSDLKNQVI